MTDTHKLKGILAFLCCLFGEDLELTKRFMRSSPEYILEKWYHYIKSNPDEPISGLHPLLKTELFDKYFKLWGIDND